MDVEFDVGQRRHWRRTVSGEQGLQSLHRVLLTPRPEAVSPSAVARVVLRRERAPDRFSVDDLNARLQGGFIAIWAVTHEPLEVNCGALPCSRICGAQCSLQSFTVGMSCSSTERPTRAAATVNRATLPLPNRHDSAPYTATDIAVLKSNLRARDSGV